MPKQFILEFLEALHDFKSSIFNGELYSVFIPSVYKNDFGYSVYATIGGEIHLVLDSANALVMFDDVSTIKPFPLMDEQHTIGLLFALFIEDIIDSETLNTFVGMSVDTSKS